MDIFVSYAREDEELVKRLCQALESQGWSVFWDRRIPAGSTWDDYIGRALAESRCVIVAWSETSVSSEFVREEAEHAKHRGVLVPVLLEEVTPPFGFSRIQAADLSGWAQSGEREVLEQLFEDIRRLLSRGQHEAESRAKREAEEEAQREVEARAKRQAEEQGQREAEACAKRQAEEEAQREAEARAKRQAEEETQREVEARAKRQAEEQGQREAEARAKRQAEEQAQREAQARARQQAEERAQREAQARARRQAEEEAQGAKANTGAQATADTDTRAKAELVKTAASSGPLDFLSRLPWPALIIAIIAIGTSAAIYIIVTDVTR